MHGVCMGVLNEKGLGAEMDLPFDITGELGGTSNPRPHD